jgi:hypothetical protein
MRKITACAILFLFQTHAFSQTYRDKVGELISAENYFSALVKGEGIKKAFLKVSVKNTLVFRPGPVRVVDYYSRNPDSGILSWEPAYAKISKSADWGFTTGPYTYKKSDTSSNAGYGTYLSVWKKNEKGVWKLALDAGIPHPKPSRTKREYDDAEGRFLQQHSESRLKQREDIVLSSDKLYATILKADNNIAHKEFLADDTRLLFPGYQPIIGKKAVDAFWAKQKLRINSTPSVADRAYSGELAYTYGSATIAGKGENKVYSYVRIWQVQPGFIWKVLLELFIPGE